MNRNAAIVLAIVVIGALALGAIYVPQILEDMAPVSTSVEFHDADGDLIPLAIYGGGAEVTTMTVKVKWTVDATNIDPATFNAHVEIVVELEDEYTGVYGHFDTRSIDSSVMVQTTYVEVYTWVLADVLPMERDWKDHGWNLRIKSTLTPTANDLDGVAVTPDPPSQSAPTVTASLTWIDTTASMTIISVEVNRWLVP